MRKTEEHNPMVYTWVETEERMKEISARTRMGLIMDPMLDLKQVFANGGIYISYRNSQMFGTTDVPVYEDYYRGEIVTFSALPLCHMDFINYVKNEKRNEIKTISRRNR